jgi:hypothetical protein
LGPVRHLELGEDVRHLIPNRLRAQVQLSSDGLVVQSLGDVIEDLPLRAVSSGNACGGPTT